MINQKICKCCQSLEKAISRYLAKVEEGLAEELSEMGYADAEQAVKNAGDLEDAIAEELEGQTDRIVEFLKGCATLEVARAMLDIFFDEDNTREVLQDVFTEYYREDVPRLANVYIRETDGELIVSQIRKRTSAWISEWSRELSDLMQITSEQQIGNLVNAAIENGEGVNDLARRIMDAGIRKEPWRARRVALTEMLRAHSVAQQEAMIQDPSVSKKKWRHTGNYRNDPRKNHVDMNGQIVPVDKRYKLEGIKGGIHHPMYPRDTILPPEESINCHCLSQPIVDDDVLGMDLEERQELQRQIIEEDDGKWMEEQDVQNRAKAGINEDTVRLDWINEKSREQQIRYFGGGEAGKQRLALVESGVISTDEELEKLYKVNNKGKRVRKSLQELADDGIFTVSSSAMKHATVGDYTNTNRLAKGGHSQAAIDYMDEKGIKYYVTKTYSNGVRIGYVENHKTPTKNGDITKRPNADVGQAWFPENWNEDDVRNAGTFVANKGIGTEDVKFAEYKGVKVGIYVDSNGNPTTIFPHNMKQPGKDGTMEGARD
ncbi:MAG: hypothetical protein HFI82_10655 [Eubacterium sp.]|nr:hypothetical protein [Eubacterium sp.]